MTSTTEDRLAIHELIALHGHVFDMGALDQLHELFTDDVVYDVDDLGGGAKHGIAAIREAAQTLGDQNPLGHHTTNVVVLAFDRQRDVEVGHSCPFDQPLQVAQPGGEDAGCL